MVFHKDAYTVEEAALFGQTVRYRAWRNILYVKKPLIPEYQQLHLFAPEALFAGESVNGYRLATAPVFVPNTVGGYMPGALNEPGEDRRHPGQANAVFQALRHGYVVAAPAIRGRSQAGGQAPACIVDYKAVVRWLRFFAGELPGDEDKIITSGTSAGGALSALMGAAGDHPDYEPYLREIGAAEASDAVFAASCYCPITNLDHADMAYEWEFAGVYDYHRKHMRKDEGGRPSFEAVDGELSELQRRTSRELAANFPAYVNSLELKDETGAPLTLDPQGGGPGLRRPDHDQPGKQPVRRPGAAVPAFYRLQRGAQPAGRVHRPRRAGQAAEPHGLPGGLRRRESAALADPPRRARPGHLAGRFGDSCPQAAGAGASGGLPLPVGYAP